MFNLNINNFRSFQEQDFNFSRINILIGENSGGKSSLIKFLLACKQTLNSQVESNFKLKGNLIDLGNYEEMIYQKESNRDLKFKFSNTVKYAQYFTDNYEHYIDFDEDEKKRKSLFKIIEKYINEETSVEFTINKNLSIHNSIKTIFSNAKAGTLEIIPQLKSDNEDFFNEMKCDLVFNFKKVKGVVKNVTFYKEGFFSIINANLKKILTEQHPEHKDFLFYTIAYLLLYQNFLIINIDKLRYVNPILGRSPKRFYFQEDRKSSYNITDIEKFINIIGDPFLTKKESKERIDTLNKVIKKLGIAEKIEIKKNEEMSILSINVKTKEFWSNLTDVGYGVSLQLPILFQAILSENYTNGQTLLIEQPEVHLHPKLQANFIETLLSIGNKNSYFIETHSEHMVRKLQVLVKNKTFGITNEDVRIYYFKRGENKFEITEHKITEDGLLDNIFPNGFYDTSYNLAKDLI